MLVLSWCVVLFYLHTLYIIIADILRRDTKEILKPEGGAGLTHLKQPDPICRHLGLVPLQCFMLHPRLLLPGHIPPWPPPTLLPKRVPMRNRGERRE